MAYCLNTLAQNTQKVKLKIIQMTKESNNQITGSTDTQSADRSLLEYLKPKSEDRFSKLEAYCDLTCSAVRHPGLSLLPMANVVRNLFPDSSLPVSLSLPASGNGSVPQCAPLWRVLWHLDNSRTSLS